MCVLLYGILVGIESNSGSEGRSVYQVYRTGYEQGFILLIVKDFLGTTVSSRTYSWLVFVE